MPDLGHNIVVPFRAGILGTTPVQALSAGDGSKNFYPDPRAEGYLVNYPGRTDFFRRDTDSQAKPWLGIPPATDVPITRLLVFRDFLGTEHLVFVRAGVVCETWGNGYRSLVTLTGRTYEGLFFPSLCVHQSKLFIANDGDPIYVWDGVDPVTPCGVTEVPAPPDLRISGNLFETWNEGHNLHEYTEVWWPQALYPSGPTANLATDGTTKLWGYYECVIQFVDKYGNKGRASAPSVLTSIKPSYQIDDGIGHTAQIHDYLLLDYTTPVSDSHIQYVIIGRTLNQNAGGGAGTPGVYHQEELRANVVDSRKVCTLSDTTLAAQEVVDTTVGPMPSCGGLSSWNGYLLAWDGPEKERLYVSDPEQFGQHHDSNDYIARDHIRFGGSLGDRYVVITRSTTEVLYRTNAGALTLLEQHPNHGSYYGRSFVEVDGKVFGLWGDGFAFYDGQTWEAVPSPYFFQDSYVDDRFYVLSAVVLERQYILTVRKDGTSGANNFLLMFHLDEKTWHLLEESVYDLAVYDGQIIGCDDSIYELFKGAYTGTATWVVKDYIPQGASPLEMRTLTEVRLLAESSSSQPYQVTVEAGQLESSTTEAGFASTSPNQVGRGKAPYWDQPALQYDSVPSWGAPGDTWWTPVMKGSPTGYCHTLTFSFATGHQVRLKAAGLVYGESSRSAY